MRIWIISFMLILGSFPAYAEKNDRAFVYQGQKGMPDYKGEFNILITHLPKFEDYPADVSPYIAAEKIDWDYKNHVYKDRIDEQLKSLRPDVAGFYKVVTVGCGTSCQGNFIINLKTGKMIGGLSSSYGIQGRLDSRLVIVNAPGVEGLIDLDGELGGSRGIQFYEINDDKLRLVSRISVAGESYYLRQDGDD